MFMAGTTLLTLSGCATPEAGANVGACTAASSRLLVYMHGSQPVERRIEDLLARMTLEEKVGQMLSVRELKGASRHRRTRAL